MYYPAGHLVRTSTQQATAAVVRSVLLVRFGLSLVMVFTEQRGVFCGISTVASTIFGSFTLLGFVSMSESSKNEPFVLDIKI